MRSDPSDTGGLFVGRRPGTAPTRFRELPKRGGRLRQRIDGSLAGTLLARDHRPQPALLGTDPARLPVDRLAGRLLSGSVSFGILIAFVGLLVFPLRGARAPASPRPGMDSRAARRRPRPAHRSIGADLRATAAICGVVFTFWFVVINGPGVGGDFHSDT